AELVAFAALGQQADGGGPGALRLANQPARPGDVAFGAIAGGVLQPIVGEASQPARTLDRALGIVEPAEGAERLATATLELEHQVAFRRDALREDQRFVVTAHRVLDPTEVEIELAQEFESQHFLPAAV